MAKKRIKDSVRPAAQIKTEYNNYPVFCFKYLQSNSIDECDNIFFRHLIERAKKLADLGWVEINKSARHCFGYEKIELSKIKCRRELPSFVTKEVKLLAFRYSKQNLPFLAIRQENTLHVIFIETKHGDIYDHG